MTVGSAAASSRISDATSETSSVMESEKDKPSSPPFTSSKFLATSFSPTFAYSLFYPAVNLNAKF